MKVTIKAFGISRDILGNREVQLDMSGNTVSDLRNHLISRYPAFIKLNSLFIAVNQNYAEETQTLHENDEIALIPPVSGG